MGLRDLCHSRIQQLWVQRGAGSPVAMLLARTGLGVPLPDHTLLFIETRERKQ